MPPANPEVEKAVIGAIMLDVNALEVCSDLLKPQFFYVDAHQRIYSAFLRLAAKNERIDLMTTAAELIKSGELEVIGGAFTLTGMTNFVTSSANIETHCRIIVEHFLSREIIRIAGTYIGQAYDGTIDVFDKLENFEKDVLAISGDVHKGDDVIDMGEVMLRSVEKIEYYRSLDSHITGVPSGYKELDRVIRGWQPTNLIIIAARPSVGKTAFLLNLVRNAAAAGYPVAVWSLEMKVYSLGLRMISAQSNEHLFKLQTGRMDDHEMQRLSKHVNELAKLPIYFDEKPNLTISRIRSQARRMKKKFGIKMLVIDYLQLMTGDKGQNREQEISTISRNLKNLANELEIPIIALSQLSRDIEKRSKPVPMLSDLRESGAIEQDADVVVFLYGATEEEVKEDASKQMIRYAKVAKHRDGVLQTVDLVFKNDTQLFLDPNDPRNQLPEGNWKPVQQLSLIPPTPADSKDPDDMPF